MEISGKPDTRRRLYKNKQDNAKKNKKMFICVQLNFEAFPKKNVHVGMNYRKRHLCLPLDLIS